MSRLFGLRRGVLDALQIAIERIDRGQLAHCARQHREHSRIFLTVMPRCADPQFDLGDLPFGRTHHSLDQRAAIARRNAKVPHDAPPR